MPHRPITPPADPLVRSFLKRRPGWSAGFKSNATSTYNRWAAYLAARGVDDLTEATGDHVADYLTDRQAGTTGLVNLHGRRVGPVSGTTAHKEWQHLTALYAWLSAEGELPDVKRGGTMRPAPRLGPCDGVTPPKMAPTDPDRTRHVTEADYRRVMRSFKPNRAIDCRNAAICSVMYRSGLRMSEIVRADLADYDDRDGTLAVLGKNNTWRVVPLLEETRELIDRYLRRRRHDPSPALFASTLGGTEGPTTGRMRPDAVASMLERRCAKLGIHVTAHMFRRAAAIDAKRRGVPETEVARALGWSPSSAKVMIPRYTRSDADRLTTEAWRDTDPTAPRGARARALRRAS
jgi:integrase